MSPVNAPNHVREVGFIKKLDLLLVSRVCEGSLIHFGRVLTSASVTSDKQHPICELD